MNKTLKLKLHSMLTRGQKRRQSRVRSLVAYSQGGQSEKAVSPGLKKTIIEKYLPTGFSSMTVTLMRTMLRKLELVPIS